MTDLHRDDEKQRVAKELVNLKLEISEFYSLVRKLEEANELLRYKNTQYIAEINRLSKALHV